MSEFSPLTDPSCGCCAGVVQATPGEIANRPGLSAIAYRIGKHGDFLASLQARLSAAEYPALAALRTREPDDLSLALLDGFSCMADVLTFYQERVANEAYVGTAGERRSLVELARLLGYRLRPGVAAETWLAFTLETAQGAPEQVTLATGVQIQSVPGPDEKPQTFETLEPLLARPEWNLLKPRPTRAYPPVFGRRSCYLRGANLNLKVGDGVLILGPENRQDPTRERWDFRLLTDVESDPTAGPLDPATGQPEGRTRVAWARGLGSTNPPAMPTASPEIYVLRKKSGVFGHNAPLWRSMSVEFKNQYGDPTNDDWPDYRISAQYGAVDLETTARELKPDSWLVMAKPNYVELYRVAGVSEVSRAEYALSGKVTRADLRRAPRQVWGENYDKFYDKVRETTVHFASERLVLSEAPDETPISGDSIVLDRAIAPLPIGRVLLVCGIDADTGSAASDVVVVRECVQENGLTRLTLSTDLERRFVREGLSIYANVARGGHGESVHQILGSGSAARADQRFLLKHAPLTHTPAETESGAEAALELRVGDILWHERATLFGAASDERVFTLRQDDNGVSRVQFGDGMHGARLPTGSENVRARYRKGLGRIGNVRAASLTQLMTRPLGVKAVINPRPAEGGSDPEAADAARGNMPLGVRTLGRVVSLLDYADFSRAFSGIAKAQARVLNLKAGRTIVVTVAGEGGDALDPYHPTLVRLLGALKNHGDPHVRVEVRTYRAAYFHLRLKLKRDPDYLRELVWAAVETALRNAFGFAARDLGQTAALSELIAVAAAVPGVIAVDVDRFHRGGAPSVQARLFAAPASVGANGEAVAAELLMLSPEALVMEDMP